MEWFRGSDSMSSPMSQRQFLIAGVAVLGAVSMLGGALTATDRFTLKYAPHPGMFAAVAGEDYIAQLEFAADQEVWHLIASYREVDPA